MHGCPRYVHRSWQTILFSTRALAYGATILFSTVSIGCMQLPARLKGYVIAFKALQPHRLHQVNAMPAEDMLNEPLFFNQQISVPLGSSATGSADDSTTSRPLTPHDQPFMLAAGITKVAHLQVFFFFFFFFLGGKDIHYTSAMIATSRVCDVHHKPKRPKLTTHLEWCRHES